MPLPRARLNSNSATVGQRSAGNLTDVFASELRLAIDASSWPFLHCSAARRRFGVSLGHRLMVGLGILVPAIQVRALVPQPRACKRARDAKRRPALRRSTRA